MRKDIILLFLICFFPASMLYGQETVELKIYRRTLSLTGFTEPVATVVVSSEIAGKLENVMPDVGDAIPLDGRIAVLDATFAKLELEKNTIMQLQTQRQLELEQKTLARYKNLITKNSTTQASFDEAQLQTDVLSLKIRQLKNEETALREKLERHILSGPPGWKVIERVAEPGEYLRPGDAVVRLGNFKEPVVSFLLTIEELQLLRNMSRIDIYFPEISRKVAADIYRISPDMDERSRKIQVDLKVDTGGMASSQDIRGGLRARLQIKGKKEPSLFAVPLSALLNRYEAYWLVTVAGEKVRVNRVGGSEDGTMAVISGSALLEKERYRLNPSE